MRRAVHAFALRLVMVLGCVAALAPFAAADDDGRVAVGAVDLVSESVPPAELAVLSDRLRSELFQTGRFRVVEREQMEEILSEQGFQQSGCSSTDCVVEIGRLIGAQKMVAGTVGRVGNIHTVSLRIIDVETGVIEETAAVDCRCTLEEVLTRRLSEAAARLAGITPDEGPPGERGELQIVSTPPGAHISLNGRLRETITPALFSDLPAGEHTIALTLDSLSARETVVVRDGELTRVELRLSNSSGTLSLSTEPAGATATVDGTVVGVTPLVIQDLRPGHHPVELTLDGHVPWSRDVDILVNRRVNISTELQPAGYLNVHALPQSAAVDIDGQTAGRGHIINFPVPAGMHTVTVTAAGYDTLRQIVSIDAGGSETIRAKLRNLLGAILVETSPGGAEISLDPSGISGFSPLRADSLVPGQYMLHVTRPRYLPHQEEITIRRGELSRINVDLQLTPAARHARAQRVKGIVRWTMLGVSALAAGIGYVYNGDAQDAYDERLDLYGVYTPATTTASAVSLRDQATAAGERGDSAATKRNIFYGIAAAGLTVSVALTIW